MITAKEWREMETAEILQSLDIATDILSNRSLTNKEEGYLLFIIKNLLDVVYTNKLEVVE